MSLYLTFEPHSWYRGFAIQDLNRSADQEEVKGCRWRAFTDDGRTYRIVELEARTVRELRQCITEYWEKHL